GSALCSKLRKLKIESCFIKFTELVDDINGFDKVKSFIEGFMLRNYDFSKYQKNSHEGQVKNLYFWEDDLEKKSFLNKALNEGVIFSSATIFCRDIANEPGNFMTPVIMSQKAESLSKSGNITCRVFDEK